LAVIAIYGTWKLAVAPAYDKLNPKNEEGTFK
jgi:hypothetical protein